MELEELSLLHPCFAKGAKNQKGRIHLPVSPGCNIECRFCKRDFNDFEQAPGVTASLLNPEEALEAVKRAKKLCPDITVAGIAGPGDTLATDYALETFVLIKENDPDMIACMSTNGLLLPEKADQILEAGIDSLTVTVNAVEPEIEAEINAGITYHGQHYEGIKAARILIHNQLTGIRKIASKGITVKVNTVLIPGINDEHIGQIAKTISDAGARIYNIIPLIPRHELSGYPAPTCAELDAARQEAEKYIQVFRHCMHCRADAAGILGGEDIGEQIFLKRIQGETPFSHG